MHAELTLTSIVVVMHSDIRIYYETRKSRFMAQNFIKYK